MNIVQSLGTFLHLAFLYLSHLCIDRPLPEAGLKLVEYNGGCLNIFVYSVYICVYLCICVFVYLCIFVYICVYLSQIGGIRQWLHEH